METSEREIQAIAEAIFWQLGIRSRSNLPPERSWQDFARAEEAAEQLPVILEVLPALLSARWKQIFAYRLGLTDEPLPKRGTLDHLDRLWDCFINDLPLEEARELKIDFCGRLKEALLAKGGDKSSGKSSMEDSAKSQKTRSPKTDRPEENLVECLTKPPKIEASKSKPLKDRSPQSESLKSEPAKNESPRSESPKPKPSTAETSKNEPLTRETSNSASFPFDRPAMAAWKYYPIAETLDRHEESDRRFLQIDRHLQAIGARVRGKKHKHEGTNCDDWFEMARGGPWTIVAVSDGAGSRKFSRIGAKVSCEAAVDYLARRLRFHDLQKRSQWTADTFQRNAETGRFAAGDIEYVQESLHQAMQAAYRAIEKTVRDRASHLEYYQRLNYRALEVQDLAATLLLAVCTNVSYKNKTYSFALTCQVGDGLLAAIDCDRNVQILSRPDSGRFAGQTAFITSLDRLDRDRLSRKTFPFFRPLGALLVMTDGVADDYFPHEAGMLELYGDLILNRIIESSKPSEREIIERLRQTQLGSSNGIAEARERFQFPVSKPTADGVETATVASIADYARETGLSIAELLRSPAILWAGSSEMTDEISEVAASASPAEKLAEKLKVWLDFYYRRGSFDDRTLVVLHREATAWTP